MGRAERAEVRALERERSSAQEHTRHEFILLMITAMVIVALALIVAAPKRNEFQLGLSLNSPVSSASPCAKLSHMTHTKPAHDKNGIRHCGGLIVKLIVWSGMKIFLHACMRMQEYMTSRGHVHAQVWSGAEHNTHHCMVRSSHRFALHAPSPLRANTPGDTGAAGAVLPAANSRMTKNAGR